MRASIGLERKEFLLTANWPGVWKLRVFSQSVLLDDPQTNNFTTMNILWAGSFQHNFNEFTQGLAVVHPTSQSGLLQRAARRDDGLLHAHVPVIENTELCGDFCTTVRWNGDCTQALYTYQLISVDNPHMSTVLQKLRDRLPTSIICDLPRHTLDYRKDPNCQKFSFTWNMVRN